LHEGPPAWVEQRARSLAQALQISAHFKRVFTLANDINLVSHLPDLLPKISLLNPSAMFLHVGSNDMAHIVNPDPMRATALADTVCEFAMNVPCPRVIIGLMLPRAANMTCSAETFRTNADVYNKRIRQHCAKNKDKLSFSKHQGITSYVDGQNRHQSRTIEEWSCDGIHLREEFMTIYQRRIARALLSQVTHLPQPCSQ